MNLKNLKWFLLGCAVCMDIATAQAQLRIEPIVAYNLIVDSNVETPATYAPEAFMLGAEFCNDGTNVLSNVVAYAGSYNDGTNASVGIFPARTNPPTGQVGTFQLVLESGSLTVQQDGTRFTGTLQPGQCIAQYWLVSYPRLDDNGESVTRGIKPDDDLWLEWDMWATAEENGSPVETTTNRNVYMRNEISAMANKIWPNGDNKVPEIYRNAINAVVGWDTFTPGGGNFAYPGETVETQGIWYDLGNVVHGFDNDGDFVPDQNAWMQPIGDPTLYDPGCFRLVRAYGILIVKLKTGGEYLIPFNNQLYFENLPDNNGVVGLVFYEFISMNGVCTASMTPYQEVASGFDNEKFNGDYGTGIPPLITAPPTIEIEKDGTPFIGPDLPDTTSYGIIFSNNGPPAVGIPEYGLPLVLEDSIPTSMTYVAGSATASNILPTGVTAYDVYYSTNNGTTYQLAEPAAATVTDIRWSLVDPMPSGTWGRVGFEITTDATFTNRCFINIADIQLLNGTSMSNDSHQTCVLGSNAVQGTVFEDTNSPPDFADGQLDAGEPGITGVIVSLYVDVDGDGFGDNLWDTRTTDAAGFYSFSNLPNGDYVVYTEIVPTNRTEYEGWVNTTFTQLPIPDLQNSEVRCCFDFGFAPALTLQKTAPGNPIYENQTVEYTIYLKNNSRGDALSAGESTNTEWLISGATTSPSTLDGAVSGDNFDNDGNAVDGLNGTEAEQTGNWPSFPSTDYLDNLVASEFEAIPACGNIEKVEAVYAFRIGNLGVFADDTPTLSFWDPTIDTGVNDTSLDVPGALITNFAQTTELRWDITTNITAGGGSLTNWAMWDGTTPTNAPQLGIIGSRRGSGNDGLQLFVDNIGIRLTVSGCTGGASVDNTINPLPLVDTFDTSKLSFVSSNFDPDVVDSTNGIIEWDNVGPLEPQESVEVTVTFLALEEFGNTNRFVTNIATVTNAFFAVGLPTTDHESIVTNTIEATGKIQGYIWSDPDGDGWQGVNGYEGTDFLIPGVDVYLYECFSVAAQGTCSSRELVATNTTDANGFYEFVGVETGRYWFVGVATNTIVGFTPGDQTGDPDDDPTNGEGNGGTCGSGGANVPCDNEWEEDVLVMGVGTWAGDAWIWTNVNFGYDLPAAIFGVIFHDVMGDGTFDVSDPGISNVTVELQDGVCTPGVSCSTTVVNAQGEYQFLGLNGGTYNIAVYTNTLPTGGTWTNTYDPDGTNDSFYTVTISDGQISGSHDFGYYQSGDSVIGDTVYIDWNGDGIQDPSDEGIPNVEVCLFLDQDSNGIIDAPTNGLYNCTTTDVNGVYIFTNLGAGEYIARVDQGDIPPFYSQTGDPDEWGMTCTGCNHRGSAVVYGMATSFNYDVDFGYMPSDSGEIGDTVWYDANGDGIQLGVTEIGFSNVAVELYGDLNGDGTYVLITTTNTDANGLYYFSNLVDGIYRVIVDAADTNIPNDAFGNDSIPTTPLTSQVYIGNGSVTNINGSSCTNCNYDSDFGFTFLGAIGDFVFWDNNENGTQDFGEPGITGVTVFLCYKSAPVCNSGSALESTVTDPGTGTVAAGYYVFDGLMTGLYVVAVDTSSLPAGVVQMADPDADGVPCTDTSVIYTCDSVHTNIQTIRYGVNYFGADFGYQPVGMIGDFVWFDQDGDGVQDPGEPGIDSMIVSASNGTSSIIVTTDLTGYYFFNDLSNGTWTITVSTPSNYTATFDVDGGLDLTADVVISNGYVSETGNAWCPPGSNCSLDVDFGFELDGDLGLAGTVCLDDDTQDGVCTVAGDTLLSGYVVWLYNEDGDLLGSTSTDTNGNYSFTNLVDDSYVISISTAGQPPLDAAALTTQLGDTPATNVTEIVNVSAYQIVPLGGVSQENLDFAFFIDLDLDFGDLPISYNTLWNDIPQGPSHELDTNSFTLYFGGQPDVETDGAPSILADGDGADEDGVNVISPFVWSNGVNGGSVTVEVTGVGYVVGYYDWNQDGDFLDAGEMVVDQPVSSGTHVISFDIPTNTLFGAPMYVYSRWRLFPTEPILAEFSYQGRSSNGEVEDYQFLVGRWPGAIGDYIWNDEDADGLQDASEQGIPNVTVILYDSTGTNELARTVTDLYGGYLFPDLDEGDYVVEVDTSTMPAGLAANITYDPDGGADSVSDATVIAGEENRDIDFGYTWQDGDNSATIGDRVWRDVDGDGVQDANEIGIGGVDVLLYDLHLTNVIIIATNTTDDAGFYIFDNLATGRYAVVVDTNTLPAGAIQTGDPDPTLDNGTDRINLQANQVLLTVDFGYDFPDASDIGDTIFFDADSDGTYEPGAGEYGIEGVTVALLHDANSNGVYDAGDQIIASDRTDANGNYLFPDVPADNYIVLVTDTDNQLGGYQQTYDPDATLDGTSFVTTDGTSDYLDEDFGYGPLNTGVLGTIGDTVFIDRDNDGTYDDGEGYEGAAVYLYNSSTQLIRVLTTDENGRYIFSQLAGGTYFVQVATNTLPAGLNNTVDPDGGNDSYSTVTITNGGVNLDQDFGYFGAIPNEIRGTVWLDENYDGTLNTNEFLYFANMQIDLIDTNGNVVGSTTTDGSGDYQFTGLPDGNYTLRVNNYDFQVVGFTQSDGPNDGIDSNAQVNLYNVSVSGGDTNVTADFGFFETFTPVVLAGFNGQSVAQGILLGWETVLENGTVGFNILRQDKGTRAYNKVNDLMLPAIPGAVHGGIYRYLDDAVDPTETQMYKLEEITRWELKPVYGPFKVDPSRTRAKASPVDVPRFEQQEKGPAKAKLERLAKRKSSAARGTRAQQVSGQYERIAVEVRDGGVVYLDTVQLAQQLSLDVKAVRSLLKQNLLKVTSGGVDIPVLADAQGMFFVAREYRNVYTDSNVYWIEFGESLPMSVVKGSSPAGLDAGTSFQDTVTAEEDVYPATPIFDDPDGDYWLWDFLVAGFDGYDTKDFNVELPSATGLGSGQLVLALHGATPTRHSVTVSINGNPVGASTWSGVQSHTMTLGINGHILSAGANTVQVKANLAAGSPYSTLYVDAISVTYDRAAEAQSGQLVVRGDGQEAITVTGFDNRSIGVFNIANPDQPSNLEKVQVKKDGGKYAATFVPENASDSYLVVDYRSVGLPETGAFRESETSYLRDPNHVVDYLVITPASLRSGADQLAAYRASKGMKVLVVELDEIMDEFAEGRYTPWAIKAFLKYAYGNWGAGPSYVVLVGEGTYDYRNIKGLNENLMPPMMAASRNGMFPSDNRYADVNDDGIPDMPIGRIPVANNQEMVDYVAKVTAYEASEGGDWAERTLFVSDDSDSAGDFQGDSDFILGEVPEAVGVEKVYLGDLGTAAARQQTIDGINQGALLLNYLGHGGLDRMAEEGLLKSTDVPGLANGDKLPLLVTMTCVLGNYGIPGVDCLGEQLVVHNQGGAIAAWVPTGLSNHGQAVLLNKDFLEAWFNGNEKVLGDALWGVMNELGNAGYPAHMLDIYTLLGDPALEIK